MTRDDYFTFDSAGERAGALHEHIASDPDLSALQDRLERAQVRVSRVAQALAVATGERAQRLASIARWVGRRARAARSALEDAVDGLGDEGPDRSDDV
jgi:hypothetical protein